MIVCRASAHFQPHERGHGEHVNLVVCVKNVFLRWGDMYRKGDCCSRVCVYIVVPGRQGGKVRLLPVLPRLPSPTVHLGALPARCHHHKPQTRPPSDRASGPVPHICYLLCTPIDDA
jgi:hypothetical protein